MGVITSFKSYMTNRFAEAIPNSNQNSSNVVIKEKVVVKEISLTAKQRANRIIRDSIYLIQQGFDFDEKDEVFYKKDHYVDGQYEGEYNLEVIFPRDYPAYPPQIFIEPNFRGKRYSPHLKQGPNGAVCVEHNGSQSAWWKKESNVATALKLALMVASGEADVARIPVQKKISIKGTIFEELSKVAKKTDFVEFCKRKGIRVYNSWDWEQIASKTQGSSLQFKKDMVRYLEDMKNAKGKNKKVSKTSKRNRPGVSKKPKSARPKRKRT